MRDKQWLNELGYHGTPRRGSMVNAALGLVFAFALAAILGIAVWLFK